MSERSAAAAIARRSSNAAPTLQRKCACGRGASSPVGDCPDWQREKAKRIQKKVLVGSTDDPLEHEADHAATRVLTLPPGLEAPRGRAPPPLHARPPQATRADAAASRGHAFGAVRFMTRSRRRRWPGGTIGHPGAPGAMASPDAAGRAATVDRARRRPRRRTTRRSRRGLTARPRPARVFRDALRARSVRGQDSHRPAIRSLNDDLNAHAFTYGSRLARARAPSARRFPAGARVGASSSSGSRSRSARRIHRRAPRRSVVIRFRPCRAAWGVARRSGCRWV